MLTPCMTVCQIDKDKRVCVGCGRSIDQIRDWTKYSDEERLQIMRDLGYAQGRRGRSRRLRGYDRD